ncbi:hypothetical protein MOUN0_C03312 [Monosporozyma unispora]|nr:hypothetical protein C6P44_004935 [Kazachstania unispora]
MPQPMSRTLLKDTTATPESTTTDLNELDLFESLLHDPINTTSPLHSSATVPITQDTPLKKDCDDVTLPIDIPFYNLLDPIVEQEDLSHHNYTTTSLSSNPPLTTLSPQMVELTPVTTISPPQQQKMDWDLSLDDLLNSITNTTTNTDTNVSSPSISSISSTSLSLCSPTTVIPRQLSSPLINSIRSLSSPLNYYSTNSNFSSASSFASTNSNSNVNSKTNNSNTPPVTSPNYELFSPASVVSKASAATTPVSASASSTTNTTTPAILNQMEGIPRSRGRKPSLIDDQLKVFHCKYCARKFKRQEHLKRHFKSLHIGARPFLCSICNKHFSRRDNLNQHIKTHRNT